MKRQSGGGAVFERKSDPPPGSAAASCFCVLQIKCTLYSFCASCKPQNSTPVHPDLFGKRVTDRRFSLGGSVQRGEQKSARYHCVPQTARSWPGTWPVCMVGVWCGHQCHPRQYRSHPGTKSGGRAVLDTPKQLCRGAGHTLGPNRVWTGPARDLADPPPGSSADTRTPAGARRPAHGRTPLATGNKRLALLTSHTRNIFPLVFPACDTSLRLIKELPCWAIIDGATSSILHTDLSSVSSTWNCRYQPIAGKTKSFSQKENEWTTCIPKQQSKYCSLLLFK